MLLSAIICFFKVPIQVWSMPWTIKLVAICYSSHLAQCEYAIWTAYPQWLQRRVNDRLFSKCSFKYDRCNQPWCYRLFVIVSSHKVQCVYAIITVHPQWLFKKGNDKVFSKVLIQVWHVQSTVTLFIICDSSHQVQCVHAIWKGCHQWLLRKVNV